MKLRTATGKRRIAAPDIDGDEVVFYPIAKVGSWEPFGYRDDPEDQHILVPVKRELLLLEEAKVHLKNGYSLRDVAAWLSAQSGRSISHQGLKDRVAQDQKRQKDYIQSSYLAKQFIEAYKKARKIEDGRLGKSNLDEADLEKELFEKLKQEGLVDAC